MMDVLKKTPINFIFLGISAALPYFVTGAGLTRWLRTEEIGLAEIGWLSLGGLIVAINFAWAPFINSFRIPILYNLLGLRRSWLVISQWILAILVFSLSLINLKTDYSALILLVMLIFFLGSVQDISLDAYRVEYDKFNDVSALASSYIIGWRIGSYLLGSLIFSQEGILSWPDIFKVIAFLLILLSGVSFLSKRVDEVVMNKFNYGEFFDAIKNLILRKDFVIILIFIAFYRVSDTVLGYMAYPLYTDLSFSGAELAYKNLGNFIATFFGAFFAVKVIQKTNVIRALFFGSILILSTNVLFSYLFLYPSFTILITINFLDTIAQAFATACFLAYLVSLIDRSFTATQHALFTSLMLIPGYLFRGYSGVLVEQVDYYNFFIICGFIGIPSVIISFYFDRGSARDTKSILKLITITFAISIGLLSLLSFEGQVFVNDNLLHFVTYFALTLVALVSRSQTNIFLICSSIFLFSFGLEVAQFFTNFRSFELSDIIASFSGIVLAYFCFYFFQKNLKNTL